MNTLHICPVHTHEARRQQVDENVNTALVSVHSLSRLLGAINLAWRKEGFVEIWFSKSQRYCMSVTFLEIGDNYQDYNVSKKT